MYMKRKGYEELLVWKTRDQGTTAMLIEGARRVGKISLQKSIRVIFTLTFLALIQDCWRYSRSFHTTLMSSSLDCLCFSERHCIAANPALFLTKYSFSLLQGNSLSTLSLTAVMTTLKRGRSSVSRAILQILFCRLKKSVWPSIHWTLKSFSM